NKRKILIRGLVCDTILTFLSVGLILALKPKILIMISRLCDGIMIITLAMLYTTLRSIILSTQCKFIIFTNTILSHKNNAIFLLNKLSYFWLLKVSLKRTTI